MDAVGHSVDRNTRTLADSHGHDAPPAYQAPVNRNSAPSQSEATSENRSEHFNLPVDDDTTLEVHQNIHARDASVGMAIDHSLDDMPSAASGCSHASRTVTRDIHTLRDASVATFATTNAMSTTEQLALGITTAGGVGVAASAGVSNCAWTYRAMRAAEETLQLVKEKHTLEKARLEAEIEKLGLEARELTIEMGRLEGDRDGPDRDHRPNRNHPGSGNGGELADPQATSLELQIKRLTIEKLTADIESRRA